MIAERTRTHLNTSLVGSQGWRGLQGWSSHLKILDARREASVDDIAKPRYGAPIMAGIQRALISVSDKTGIVEFAKGLSDAGVEILSTGGTATALRNAGIRVMDVAEYTGSPEIMDGRVKTLHPRVHGGLLMRSTEQDAKELAQIGGKPIDLVCVNLYPFEETVAKGASDEEIIENIDIGGPSMIRSAAKNFARVLVVTEPGDYAEVLTLVQTQVPVPHELRARLAGKAFARTAAYDAAIRSFFQHSEKGKSAEFPSMLKPSFTKTYDLRYGENPHQRGAFYKETEAPIGSLARAESVGAGGKELSFNNLVDLDAALDAAAEFEMPAAVIVKHANPCGVAQAETLETAYRNAREADALSAFGGIAALNRPVDGKTAKAIAETFIECVIAPSFSEEALEILRAKNQLRVLSLGGWPKADAKAWQLKRVSGGVVVQDRDATASGEVRQGKVVTQRAPSESEWMSLDFAWRVCKHVKSNAIVLAKDFATVGVGAGQMSRVVSVEIACKKAGELAKNSVLASDAFFPFADGLEAAAAAGVVAAVQPGGSKKDAEVIAAADKARIAMVFTGVRHFRH